MSDFSDAADNLLVQLALAYNDGCGTIDWKKIARMMLCTGKTQVQLRSRLRTLMQTHGKDLAKFPRRFFRTRIVQVGTAPVRRAALHPRKIEATEMVDISASVSNIAATPLTTPRFSEVEAHKITLDLLHQVSRRDVAHRGGCSHLNTGELTASSVSRILRALPVVEGQVDSFADIGAGVGNVVIQVALESTMAFCVGVEIREELVTVVTRIVRDNVKTYPELRKVWMKQGDVVKMPWHVTANLQACSVIYCSNVLFNARANAYIEDIACYSRVVRAVVLLQKPCARHTKRCAKLFCQMFRLYNTLQVDVHWTSSKTNVFIYERATALLPCVRRHSMP